MDDEKSLEQRIGPGQRSSEELSELMPLENYVSRFTQRYYDDGIFRKMVHKYIGLTGLGKFGLSFTRLFLPRVYKRKTNYMIRDYAAKTRDDLGTAIEAREKLNTLRQAETEVQEKGAQAVESEHYKRATESGLREVIAEQDTALTKLESDYEARRAEEQARLDQKETELSGVDAKRIVAAKLSERISASPLVIKDSFGQLRFDEEQICRKLEEIFLDEIVQGIEREGGAGFMARVQGAYEDVVSYWSEMEDLSELPRTDWVQSIIHSRTKGCKTPTFPYLVTGKGESLSKSSIDTAIVLDTSSSMEGNKFEVAKKTCLAQFALMRRLNPRNETFLAHYNYEVYKITAANLIKSVHTTGYTRTDLALNWLYETLENRAPSIAYLITDGVPESTEHTMTEILEMCKKAAANFSANPLVMLRIFLIDGDERSEGIIRQIGRAAGDDTKVIPVKDYELAGGVIKDVSAAIKEMYDIANF